MTQKEVSLVVFDRNLVIGWNDSSVCSIAGASRFSGYGTSENGELVSTGRGDIPAAAGIDPLADPSVAADSEGNFCYPSLGSQGILIRSRGVKSAAILIRSSPAQPMTVWHSAITRDHDPFVRHPALEPNFDSVVGPCHIGDSNGVTADPAAVSST
jgi:hypothetical protein